MSKFNLQDAIEAHLRGEFDKAGRMYTAILAQYPTAAMPYFYRASLAAQQNNLVDSAVYLERCVALEEIPAAYNNLGTVYRRLNHQTLAMEKLQRGLDVCKEDDSIRADLNNNLGTTYINEGEPQAGEPYLRAALEQDPNHVQAHWNLGLLKLEQREWEEGWREYHWGVQSKDRMNRWAMWPQWHREKGKTLIYGEQGLGDEIMFSSLLHDAKDDADILLECHPRLETIFKRTFDFPIYPTRKLPYSADIEKIPEFEYRSAIGDLGMLYRNSEESFPKKPFLKLDRKKLNRIKRGYENYKKPWIGIGWKGGYAKTRRELRSLPLESWLPILEAGSGTFFSFQYEPQADQEVDAFCKQHPDILLYHFPAIARADDYDTILHHLACMDCVIHVNGSAVHGCGAIGQPCYTLTPSRPAWRYTISGEDMPFYGENVKQIRQENDDWQSCVSAAAEKVAANDFPKRLKYGY
jgi:tetratricopeptide (TPR) repeat protein